MREKRIEQKAREGRDEPAAKRRKKHKKEFEQKFTKTTKGNGKIRIQERD